MRPIEELRTLGYTIVEYALQSSRSPTGAATCQTVRELPRGLRDQFPGPEGIARLLEGRGMKGEEVLEVVRLPAMNRKSRVGGRR